MKRESNKKGQTKEFLQSDTTRWYILTLLTLISPDTQLLVI